MTVHDADGRVIGVYASGEHYKIVIFDKAGPRIIELGDRDAALRFAKNLFIAGLDAMDD